MIKAIIPLLLALFLLGCSANQTVCDTSRCKSNSCLLEQRQVLCHQDKQLCADFDRNLPAYREAAYFGIKDLDAQREYLDSYLNTPGFLHPDTEFLRHLVSDEQLTALRDLPQIQYQAKLDELKNLIPDWERFREQCCLVGPQCQMECN
jgi:hypothetical protein